MIILYKVVNGFASRRQLYHVHAFTQILHSVFTVCKNAVARQNQTTESQVSLHHKNKKKIFPSPQSVAANESPQLVHCE